MNEHMQKQMQMWKEVDQHPLNQEAIEILRALEGLEEDTDPPLQTGIPILDLLRWGEDPWLLSELGNESPSSNPTLWALEEMAIEGKADHVIKLLARAAGQPGEQSITDESLLFLKDESLKEQERLKWGLQKDLMHLLKEAQYEMNLRQQRHDQLMDWFNAQHTARQDEGKSQLNTLTPDQEEILLDLVDIVIKDTIAELTQKEALDKFEQEMLATLHDASNTLSYTLTTEQTLLLQDLMDITFEDKLGGLTQKDTLTDSEQELLEALQAAGVSLKPTPETEIIQETEIDPESKDAPNLTSTQEKVVHYSGEEVETSDSAIDCYNRGRLKHDFGQYEAAIADYDNAIHLKPNYAFAYNNRGLAKYYLGQYEAAITDYDNAIRLKPDYAFAYNNRGLAKYYLDQYEAAIADYDNAIRLRPNYALAYRNRKEAEAKLSQTCEAEQVSDITISEQETSGLSTRSLASDRDFNPKEENTVHHPEDQDKASTPQVKEKSVHYSEDQIKDIVADYFESLPTASPGYSVKREYLIQMGSDQRRADIVFLRNGKLVAIAECKEMGRVRKGIDQLKSYLCATDTFLGIFANSGASNKWTFWENHRHNNFLEIDRETFESYVYNHDKAIKDRENKIIEEVQREIDAEIRERVRKNTDTDTVEQNETDRIKHEVIEDIDRTAVVNSVKSQIAEQAKNGLLNKRDKENRKLGRAQGFWWTIFGIVGIGILIAMLITSG